MTASRVCAEVRLASVFGSHMVLQRDKPLPVWGTADAGATVTVTLGNQRATATADPQGRWSTTFAALPAGGPLTLTAASNESTTKIEDVLVGDVFLCSGQSNMQFGMGETAEFADAMRTTLPKLRLGKVALQTSDAPSDRFELRWQPASPEAAKEFSAVAYFMAYELYQQDPKLKDVPIGLLSSCMGGTVIESWMPADALKSFDPKTLASSMFGIGPTKLYNGMIAPLGRLPLAGVAWYQGEGNAAEPARYAEYLPLMIRAWREQLAQPELPFMIVQLPDYADDWGGVYWQWIRESQAKAATSMPHVGYVVAINTNDGHDLHPQGKHEIGRRLSKLVRKMVYRDLSPGRSPAFKSALVEGSTIRVTFDTDGSTLANEAGPIRGFTVAGEDGVYHAAAAHLDGPDAVVVESKDVAQPKTVRYAWAGVPMSTLSSAEGLPVAPFRLDSQPVAKGHGEIQPAPMAYAFKNPRYQMTVDGKGRVTSLVVGYKQLLSNADTPWGGALLSGPGGVHTLPAITPDGPQALRCRGGDLSAEFRFSDDAIGWAVSNNGKDAARLTIALSPQVEVSSETGTISLRRNDVAATVSGIDRVTAFDDPAADAGGRVLEVTIPPGQSKSIEIILSK